MPALPGARGFLADSVPYTTLIETQTWKRCHWPSKRALLGGWCCASLHRGTAKTGITKVKAIVHKAVYHRSPSDPKLSLLCLWLSSFTQTLQEILRYLKQDTAVQTDVSVNQSV